MNIDRHNYEEYFLLYVDNELSPADRKVVEDFVSVHTDLQTELDLMKEAVLQPEKTLSFDFKASLMKPDATDQLVNETNCEEYFLLYSDDEIDNARKTLVEQFVYHHPQHQANFELLQQVKMTPDTTVVFSDKSLLYRKEKDDKVVPFTWWRIMAAAVVLLAVGFASWFLLTNNNNQPPVVAKADPVTPAVTAPAAKQLTIPQQEPVTPSITPPTAVDNSSQPSRLLVAEKDIKRDPIKNNTAANKKTEEISNIPQPSNVPSIDNTIAQIEKTEPVVVEKTVNEAVKQAPAETVTSLVNNYPVSDETDRRQFDEDSNSDIVFVANTSVNKKSKLRGIFRKASRFIEKATNLEPHSRGIRVASVEIGLK